MRTWGLTARLRWTDPDRRAAHCVLRHAAARLLRNRLMLCVRDLTWLPALTSSVRSAEARNSLCTGCTGGSCRGPNGTKRRSLQKVESMEESEAEMSGSETDVSADDEHDVTSDVSDTEGPVQAPPSPPRDAVGSNFRHGALPPEDGVHPGYFGLDASSGEGLPREVTASQVQHVPLIRPNPLLCYPSPSNDPCFSIPTTTYTLLLRTTLSITLHLIDTLMLFLTEPTITRVAGP